MAKGRNRKARPREPNGRLQREDVTPTAELRRLRTMMAAGLKASVAAERAARGEVQAASPRTLDEIAADYAARPLQPSETIAAMTGKRGAA